MRFKIQRKDRLLASAYLGVAILAVLAWLAVPAQKATPGATESSSGDLLGTDGNVNESMVTVTAAGIESLPIHWIDGKISARCQHPVGMDASRFVRLVRDELQLYDKSTIGNVLQQVTIVACLEYAGIQVSGTGVEKTIYISVHACSGQAFPDDHIRRSVHAEIGNRIYELHKDKFPMLLWIKANPIGFRYGPGAVPSIRANAADINIGSSKVPGLLTQYSEASIWSDYEAIFANTMSDHQRVIDVIRKDKRVAMKACIMLDFVLQQGIGIDKGIVDAVRDAAGCR